MQESRIEQSGTLITIGAVRFFWIALIGLGLGFLVLVIPLPYLAGILITLTASLLILHNPYWGLLAYLVVFLVRPQEIWTTFGGHLPIEKTLAISVLIATIVSPKIRAHNKVVFSSMSGAILAFTTVIFMSVPLALWRGGALDTAMEFAKIAIVFFLITQLCDTPQRIRIFIWVYLLCHLWLAGSTIYSYYTDPAYIRMGIQRAKALTLTMGDPNSVAASLAFSIPFALMLLKTYRKPIIRLGLLALSMLSVYTIIYTGSRSGMVTLIFLAFVMAVRARHKIPALFLTVAILLSVWSVMPEMYQKRFMTMWAPEGEQRGAKQSADARWQGFVLGSKMLIDRPVLGVGVGNFPTAWYWKYTYNGVHAWAQPHNMLGQLIGELGLLGLLAFVSLYYLTVRHNLRNAVFLRRFTRPPPELAGFLSITGAISISLILLMISGLFGHNLYRYNWYYYAGLVVAMESILYSYKKKESSLPAEVTRV